jgi:hypothetical protein
LTYVGIDAITCKGELAINGEGNGARKSYSIFWQAFINDILDPKVVMFFFAFLPQFVDARGSHPTLQLNCRDAQMTKKTGDYTFDLATGVLSAIAMFRQSEPLLESAHVRTSHQSYISHRVFPLWTDFAFHRCSFSGAAGRRAAGAANGSYLRLPWVR